MLFTPAAGFSGTVAASYQVVDSRGRASNVAALNITVGPNLNAAKLLHSFESSVEGWGPASWDPGAGTVAVSTDFHTAGASSLQIAAQYGEWFGAVYATPVDISSKTHLKWDVDAQVGTSQELAIQAGDGWTWCQGGGWAWVNAGTTMTMDVDLGTLDCGAADLSQVHAMYIYLGNGGAGNIYLDNIRAE